ncbi:hypothetical protein [Roseobacter sinensis]|uniref:Uncharacterized protein n=1 Tax=Roseobacter sinensis TaxID=2931391 RepID=A0ABT3BGF6_9RHOB|nr:hypothetical protein [Roseobacter sp. WL0113]MCV3272670.1 hypothetical protein [Roseobacter sp. WL0113]
METAYDHRLILGPHSPMSVPLQRLLSGNPGMLAEVRTELPQVKLHRNVMAKTLALPIETLAQPRIQQAYIDAVRTQETTRCLIYNYDAFLGSRENALRTGILYRALETKIAPLRQLTLGHQVTVFLCLQHMTQFFERELIRNPHMRHLTETYPEGTDFSWVHFVQRLQEVWPEALVVVLDADTLPQNWAAVAALVTGHPDAHKFHRLLQFPLACLAEEGHAPCREALRRTPPGSVPEWTALMSQVFAEYGTHVPILRKVIASPWSAEQVAHSKERFASDMETLRGMENVALLDDVEWDVQ